MLEGKDVRLSSSYSSGDGEKVLVSRVTRHNSVPYSSYGSEDRVEMLELLSWRPSASFLVESRRIRPAMPAAIRQVTRARIEMAIFV